MSGPKYIGDRVWKKPRLWECREIHSRQEGSRHQSTWILWSEGRAQHPPCLTFSHTQCTHSMCVMCFFMSSSWEIFDINHKWRIDLLWHKICFSVTLNSGATQVTPIFLFFYSQWDHKEWPVQHLCSYPRIATTGRDSHRRNGHFLILSYQKKNMPSFSLIAITTSALQSRMQL